MASYYQTGALVPVARPQMRIATNHPVMPYARDVASNYIRAGYGVEHYANPYYAAAGNPAFLSPTSGYVAEWSGIAVAYVRNPDEFALNRYVTYTESPQPTGLFTVLDPDQPVRIASKAQFRWAPGTICPSPEGIGNTGNFLEVEYRCERFAYPYTIDQASLDNVDLFKAKPFFDKTILEQCMTDRTDDCIALLENPTNWGSNTASANTLNGGRGNWASASNDPASPNYLAIKRTILAVLAAINLATSAKVRPKDMRCVVSPLLAIAMAETSEIQDYLSRNEQSYNVLTGDKPSVNAMWGIPDSLYGVEFVIEDATIVREPQNSAGTPATVNRMYIKPQSTAIFLSRKDGLDSAFGKKPYSTITMPWFKDLLRVDAEAMSWERIYRARVVDYRSFVLTAPAAGYLCTGCM
jgi:hypothetical protein